MSIAGQVAVITGGAKGIGKAIAWRLGRAGARIAICGRNEEHLQATADEMQSAEIDVLQMPCDIAQVDQVKLFFEEVADRYSRIHILVNNAGVSGTNPITDADDETWHRVIQTNINGVYYCTRQALAHMPEKGRIVNISSVLGKIGVPGYTAYCTSKHAMIGFTRALALEIASRRITVNTVCPGWVDTEMARQGMQEAAQQARLPYEEARKRILRRVPLGEIVQPEEVAELVHYLVSPAAAQITGQAYNICGGQAMH